MTVISKINSGQSKFQRANPVSYYLNIFLIILTGFGFLSYVFLSNQIVSNKFKAKLLKDEYSKANIALELANANIKNNLSLESLAVFAKSRGMVESNDSKSIFDESNLAAGGLQLP